MVAVVSTLPVRVERLGPGRLRVLEEEVVALRRRLQLTELAGRVARQELLREQLRNEALTQEISRLHKES